MLCGRVWPLFTATPWFAPVAVFMAQSESTYLLSHSVPAQLLQAPLVQRRGGNLVMVKLISHEDLRSEWEDDHAQPNIDINYVKIHGNVGVQTLPLW